jgi:site-specific DNA-methyltransferase (adenine-specific)
MIVFMNRRREGKLMAKKATTLDPFLDQIHHMDSLEGMKKIPTASIDLVITSPPYADMKVYEGGFAGLHPDKYVEWFLPYVAEISRILKPTGSFILNINDKVVKTFRHPFVFELIFAIHNAEDYCKMKKMKKLDLADLKLFERLFWNKGKFLANPHRFGDKIEYLFWFSKDSGEKRKINMKKMRMEYDKKSVERMKRPLIKRFVRESGEETTEYVQGGEGSWKVNPDGALPSTMIEEGAMLHVPQIVENLEDGTTIVLENYDGETFELVQPTEGSSPHPSTIVTIGSETRRILGSHVAVYPERLMTYFIQGATDEGDVVLDPFSGTGTTSVIANALGRRYIAFDISEEYVNFARKRVASGPYLEEYKKKQTNPNLPKLSDFGNNDE